MGEIARAVLAGGGEVIGVIPQSMMTREVAFMELTDLRVVSSMHERKATMADLADGFIAMPGGLGTLEEFCEIVTWAQLRAPSESPADCSIWRITTASSSRFLDHGVTEGFIKPAHRGLVIVESDVTALLEQMETHAPSGTAHSDDSSILDGMSRLCNRAGRRNETSVSRSGGR